MSSKLFDLELPLAFGGASISGEGGGYGFGNMGESDAQKLLEYAYDQGLRVFDTAPIYGFGLSEERMGRAFKKVREEVYLVSKSGVDWHENKRVNMDNSKATTQRMLEGSLRRLNSDYIDLFMIHWPDQRVDIRLPMEVLAKAKHEGKIKEIGLCNTYPEDLFKAMEIERVDVVQSELNLFSTWSRDNLFQILKEREIAFMSWGSFDKGIITGRVQKDTKFDKDDARSWAPWWKESNKDEKIEKMAAVIPWLQERGHSGAELALAFNLSYKEVTKALVGAKSVEQIDSLLLAYKIRPKAELLAECLERFF